MIWLLPIAFLASATAFPAMLFEQPIPNWPTKERLEHGMEPDDWKRRPYHWLKNISTEIVRADSEWFSKFFCFLTLVLAILAAVLGVT